MPRIKDETREARRRAFIDAGWRCVAERGFRDLTVDDICAEAGRSKGSFYSHFREKQDLLVALLDADAAHVEGAIADADASTGAGADRIKHFLRSNMELGDEPARAQLRADLWGQVFADDALRHHVGKAVRRRRSLLAAVITEAVASGKLRDIPPNAFAAVLLALADGLVLHAAVDPGGFRWANVRRAVAVLLDGLAPDEGSAHR